MEKNLFDKYLEYKKELEILTVIDDLKEGYFSGREIPKIYIEVNGEGGKKGGMYLVTDLIRETIKSMQGDILKKAVELQKDKTQTAFLSSKSGIQSLLSSIEGTETRLSELREIEEEERKKRIYDMDKEAELDKKERKLKALERKLDKRELNIIRKESEL